MIVKPRIDNDRKAMLIAAACFVHCVAGPALLSFAGFASLIGVSEKLEPVFMLSSAGIGLAALVPAYRTKHRRISCLAMFSGGLSCLCLRRWLQWMFVPEVIAVGVGAVLIIGAHALNLKFTRQCQCCQDREDTHQKT